MQVIGILAILLYLCAGFVAGLRLVRHEDSGLISRRGVLWLGFAGILLHATVLYPHVFTPAGLDLGFFPASSLIALLTAALMLGFATLRPVEALATVLLPVAALTIGLLFAYHGHHIVPDARSWQIDLHIVLSVLAYSMLGIAALQSILLAIADHELRRRRLTGILRSLPPLQTMETILFQLITTGFALLTLALLSGIVFVRDIFSQHLVHKSVLSIGAWVVFGILLWGRWRFGWRGRTAIRWTLSGFIFLMLAYFGSKLVLELILHRT